MIHRSASDLEALGNHVWNQEEIDRRWRGSVADLHRIYSKILVLDDDPTGSQTVYDVPVYTHFDLDDLLSARRDDSKTVYVLTNSRSLHEKESEELHRRLIHNWISADSIAADPGGETLVISRGDSTLRGHYPLETDTIKNTLSSGIGATILVPAFPEGGRFTMDDIHYVRENHLLVPAAETEFARDSSFGYTSSNLRGYVEEKTDGVVDAADVVSISLESLRSGDIDSIARKLIHAPATGAVVVNAVDYNDLKVFTVAFAQTAKSGNRHIFRSAASLVKVFAGLDDKALLEHHDMFTETAAAGPGILVAGSYVEKTTRQLASLLDQGTLAEVKLNIREALTAGKFPREVRRARRLVDRHMQTGRSVCLYTTNDGRREFLSAAEGEEGLSDLELSARISAGIVEIVAKMETPPAWVVTKGGITSHDIAVKGMLIRRGVVMGQIIPGVPVWKCGAESRRPGIPLVIFPGNVGDETALARAVAKLTSGVPEVFSVRAGKSLR